MNFIGSLLLVPSSVELSPQVMSYFINKKEEREENIYEKQAHRPPPLVVTQM